MPRVSRKRVLERDLFYLFVSNYMSGNEQEAWDALILNEAVKEQRYLYPRVSIPKSEWSLLILPRLSSERFRAYARMDRSSFRKILQLIEHDPVFSNDSYNAPQAPVQNQLLIALYMLGHEGNSSGYMKTAGQWGVSEGHAFNCTKRVITALYALLDTVIKWPDENKRRIESLHNDEREGFIGAVGKIDGTDIVLVRKPGGKFDGEHFFNRKKRYALDLCAVCNTNKEITYLLAGWPNSMHDARVFASTSINRKPWEYFTPGQYLLGDAAYTNTKYLVSPYKAPDTNQKKNRRFNFKLSSVRIDIEHTFGMLKGRWASLTGLRLMINSDAQCRYAVQWISCCCILHNLLLQCNDEWQEEEGWWTPEQQDEHDSELNEMESQQSREDLLKREQVKGTVLGKKSVI